MARVSSVDSVAFVVVLVVVLTGASVSANPDACKLLSLSDATAIIGPPLTQKPPQSSAAFATCIYQQTGAPLGSLPPHVEIHYWVLSDVPTAQAKFQKVVHPGPMAGTTITTVTGLGDEADVKRTVVSNVNSIEFRSGTAVVTIGVSPVVSDSALISAGRKALNRL
jgi:hypothetical protein